MWILREYDRRARKEHFCDYCGHWIQPGEEYRGKVWVPRRGHFKVLKEHTHPRCPEDPFAREYKRQEAYVPMVVVQALVAKQVVVLARNGTPIVQTQLVCEPVCIPEPEDIANENDEEIPF